MDIWSKDNIFIHKNAFENIGCKMAAVLSWRQCYNLQQATIIRSIKYRTAATGLVMAYVDTKLGEHQLNNDLLPAIIWTKVNSSSVRSSDIHLRTISQELPQPLITKVNLKITYLNFYSNLSWANEWIITHSAIFKHNTPNASWTVNGLCCVCCGLIQIDFTHILKDRFLVGHYINDNLFVSGLAE